MGKVCPVCKVPKIIARDQRWMPNGTILTPRVEGFRLVVLEAEAFLDMYKSLEGMFGKVIPNCFTQGTRKNARMYVNGLLRGATGAIARSWIGTKLAYDALVESCMGLGFGRTKVVSYIRGRSLEVVMEDPIYPPHELGNYRGAFEAIEQIPSNGWVEENGANRFTFIVEASRRMDPLEHRFLHDESAHENIGDDMEGCRKCRLPLELERFKWDTDKFHITDMIHNERVFIFGFNDVLAIMHELEKLVNDIIREHVQTLSRPYGNGIVQRFGERAYEQFSVDCRIKGMGLPVITQNGNAVSGLIYNPYYSPLLTGRLMGIYDALTGKEAVMKTKRHPTFLEFKMMAK